MLSAFTLIPRNPSMLEASSARHRQAPLDIFLPLASSNKHYPHLASDLHWKAYSHEKAYIWFWWADRNTAVFRDKVQAGIYRFKFRSRGKGKGKGTGQPGKKDLLLLPKLWHCFYHSVLDEIRKGERGEKSFYHLHLSTFCFFFSYEKGFVWNILPSEYSTQIFCRQIQMYFIQNPPH